MKSALLPLFCSEGDTLGVRFSTAFWHSATTTKFSLAFLQWLHNPKKNKQLQDQETPKQQKHDKTRPSATTPLPWRVQSCFLFFQEFLEENQKTKNTRNKMTRPSSLLMLLPGCAILFIFFVFFGSPRILVKHKKGKTSKRNIKNTVTRPMCCSTGHTCRSCYCLLMPAIPVPQLKVAGCVDSACTCCHCGFSP